MREKNSLSCILRSMNGQSITISCERVRTLFSPELLDVLTVIAHDQPAGIYLAGGTVRDLLLGRQPADVDLTVACHGKVWARELARRTGGAFVELGQEEDAGRVVFQGETVDFSSFRAGATTIDQELTKRDLTINGLGLCIDPLMDRAGCAGDEEFAVIDPQGGVRDIRDGVIRLCSRQSIVDDPLRLLRVFRFAASLGFRVAAATLAEVEERRQLIAGVAPERTAHELDLIMASERAYQSFALMAETGLLFEIIPELLPGVGMEQPASHHLDVFEHLLETLRQMERIQRDPGQFFSENSQIMESWLARGRHRQQLKWASLFHDVGKPAAYGINEDKGGRITFYNHDLQGADLFGAIARRLRWSGEDTKFVASMIAAHMRPFFLANNQRQGKLTLKACLRLIRSLGNNLPGLFMLAMADALAGKGEGSPEEIEQEVAGLFNRMQQVWQEHVTPVRESPPLITGRDLINELGLEPGPIFRRILGLVEEAQMEHRIMTRSQALALAADYAVGKKQGLAGPAEMKGTSAGKIDGK
jgi:poly(A) polymerase